MKHSEGRPVVPTTCLVFSFEDTTGPGTIYTGRPVWIMHPPVSTLHEYKPVTCLNNADRYGRRKSRPAANGTMLWTLLLVELHFKRTLWTIELAGLCNFFRQYAVCWSYPSIRLRLLLVVIAIVARKWRMCDMVKLMLCSSAGTYVPPALVLETSHLTQLICVLHINFTVNSDISLKIIDRLGLVIENFCLLGTEFLNTSHVNLRLQA
jgi:hypothetical protein